MGAQPRRLIILSFVVSMLAIGLECASAEECDYKRCGALMARDSSVSWAVSGRHDYSPDTKRACAEFNACVRRAKNNSAGRAPAAGSSSLKSSSKDSTTVLKPEPADKQAKDMQQASPTTQGPATQPAASVKGGNSPATVGSILRASCGPDVQRLCAGARRESEVLKCLDSQRMELSPTCSLYFQKMGARPTTQGNASSKKPSSPPPTTPIPVQRKKSPSPPPTTPTRAQENAPNEKPLAPPPIAPIQAQENAPNEKPLPPPPIAPTPAQENAPNEKPTSPPRVQQNAPNKKPEPPPPTPIPD
jgi:hypothetical protein